MSRPVAIDKVLVSILSRALRAITDEMSISMEKTTRSPILNEARDFDGNGRIEPSETRSVLERSEEGRRYKAKRDGRRAAPEKIRASGAETGDGGYLNILAFSAAEGLSAAWPAGWRCFAWVFRLARHTVKRTPA